MHINLHLVNGEQIQASIDANICVIGRSSKCDIVVAEEGMSRQHCQIELIDGEVFITDLGSTNGVLIDSEKITPHTKTPFALYLTCSFGAVANLQIELEEMKGGILNTRSGGVRDATGISSTGNTSLTKTKLLKETTSPVMSKAASSRPGLPSSKAKDNKAQFWMMNGLALVILFGAVYWFINQEDETLDSPIETEKVEAPERPVDQF